MYLKKKFRRDSEAVSPVVATLMLVLVAVASVTAFFVWQSGWQQDTTENIGGNDDFNQVDLKVAGSSSVFPFAQDMANSYMKNNSDVTVTVQSIGSGAGLNAVKEGAVDIGMSSESVDPLLYPELVTYTIAYDAVVIIVSDAALTEHGIAAGDLKINAAIAQKIWCPTGTTGQITNWGGLKAAITTAFPGTPNVANGNDADLIIPIERSDSSGTEAVFRLTHLAGTETQLPTGYSSSANAVNGNSAMMTAVKAVSNDAIGFTSIGYALKDAAVEMSNYGGAALTLSNIKTEQPGLVRPLFMVTYGEAQGEARLFINYMQDPIANKEFAAKNYILTAF